VKRRVTESREGGKFETLNTTRDKGIREDNTVDETRSKRDTKVSPWYETTNKSYI
jgi:hypothetical protein